MRKYWKQMLVLLFCVMVVGKTSTVFAADDSQKPTEQLPDITAVMQTVDEGEAAAGKAAKVTECTPQEEAGAKTFAIQAEPANAARAYYDDAIILNPEYDWKNQEYTVGDHMEFHFLMFSYGNRNQKYYANIYSAATGKKLASADGYFPSTIGKNNLTITWDAKHAPGEYYLEFYSTYVTDFKGVGFPFTLKEIPGDHYIVTRTGTQKAVNENLTAPLSAWKTTSATFQRYSFKPAIKYQIQLQEIYTGDTAAYIVKDENTFNHAPSVTMQWVMMKYLLKNEGSDRLDASDILGNKYFYTSTGASAQVADKATWSGERKGTGIFDVKLYPGASGEVWVGIMIPKSAGYPCLQLSNGYDAKNRKEKISWISTDPTTYDITYVLDGGENNSNNPYSYSAKNTVVLGKPTRFGYTFGGWYSDSAYKNKVTKIAAGTTGNIKLYAKWTEKKYTIAFNGNRATSGKMSAMTSRKYGKSYRLTSNAFKRKGYTFAGWNTKSNGKGKKYSNKARVKDLADGSKTKVTLYAQWKPNTYNIRFNSNGATAGKMSTLKARKYGKSYRLSNNLFYKEGYKFVGWNTKANGRGKKYSNRASVKNLTTSNRKTVTLYAQWKKM